MLSAYQNPPIRWGALNSYELKHAQINVSF